MNNNHNNYILWFYGWHMMEKLLNENLMVQIVLRQILKIIGIMYKDYK